MSSTMPANATDASNATQLAEVSIDGGALNNVTNSTEPGEVSVDAVAPDNVITPFRKKIQRKYCTDLNNDDSKVVEARLRAHFYNPDFWEGKAAAFEELTCAKIDVYAGPYDPQTYKDDMTGPGLYSGYISDGNVIPDFVKVAGVLDVTDRVRQVPELNWFDIFANGPRQVVAYESKIYGMPLDGDVIYQVYRKDLLESAGITYPIKTMREFVRVAEYFHGMDHNDDGIPDFGVCFSTAAGDIGHQIFWALAAPYLQTEGTESGMWFNVETFEPHVTLPTFQEALSTWKRLALSSPFADYGPTTWQEVQEIMNAGRCALFVNFPGPVKILISAQNEHGLGGGKLQVARLPGVECDEIQAIQRMSMSESGAESITTCPFNVDGINYAPFYAGGGQCATIRRGSSTSKEQMLLHDVMFDFFAYVADPEVSYWDVANPASLLDPYRVSHVQSLTNHSSKEAEAFKHFEWDASQLDTLKEETLFVFEHGNGAKDLAVSPWDYQHEATMPYLLQFADGDSSLADTQASMLREWNIITQRFTLQEQRDEYRKYLGLGSYEESLLGDTKLNHLSKAVRGVGLSLFGMIVILSIVLAGWVWLRRQIWIVRVSQPSFLVMLCVGTLVMGTSIVPLSIDDGIASESICSASCMAFPWLFSLGFTITFSALYSKIRRINKIMKHANRFRRIKVDETDVMIPFAGLFTINFILLLTWTLHDPLEWTREYVSPVESHGHCSYAATSSKVFATLIVGVMCSSLVLAIIQACQARSICDELSESAYIGIAIVGWLQTFIIGIPIVFLVGSNSAASFFVTSGMIFIVCVSILLLVFIPKMLLLKKKQESSDAFSGHLSRLRSSITASEMFASPQSRSRHLDGGLRFVSTLDAISEVGKLDSLERKIESLEEKNGKLVNQVSRLQKLLETHGIGFEESCGNPSIAAVESAGPDGSRSNPSIISM